MYRVSYVYILHVHEGMHIHVISVSTYTSRCLPSIARCYAIVYGLILQQIFDKIL